MILSLTILFAAISYLYYRSSHGVYLIKGDQLNTTNEKIEKDNLYKDLEGLFI